MQSSSRLFEFFYPEPDKWDGTLAFYRWIRQYLSQQSVVLNLGAGPRADRSIRSFKGEVARVAGADVDPVVMSNDQLDDAHVVENTKLPFADATFDVILSDFVFEHVKEPEDFLKEACRVCKPGGSFFFRTPNSYHYVALIARVTPDWFHKLVANRVRMMAADAHEPWPTYYRLNTRRSILRTAKRVGFREVQLKMVEAEPSYLVFHPIPFLAGVAYERLVNRSEALAGLRANIFGRLMK